MFVLIGHKGILTDGAIALAVASVRAVANWASIPITLGWTKRLKVTRDKGGFIIKFSGAGDSLIHNRKWHQNTPTRER